MDRRDFRQGAHEGGGPGRRTVDGESKAVGGFFFIQDSCPRPAISKPTRTRGETDGRSEGPAGKVFAEDIADSLIEWLHRRVKAYDLRNVEVVKDDIGDPGLPVDSLAAVSSAAGADFPGVETGRPFGHRRLQLGIASNLVP